MKIDAQINDFEIDWASILVNKLKKKSLFLQGKRILIYCGKFHTLSRAIALAAMYYNDQLSASERKKQIYISIATGKAKEKKYFREFDYREDCNVFSLEESRIQVDSWDYVVCNEVCNCEISQTVENSIDIVNDLKLFLEFIKQSNVKKIIYLSDYRVYGTYTEDYIFSEKEMNYNLLLENKEQMLLQVLENILVSYTKICNASYIILRASIALGYGVEFNSSYFHDLFTKIAKEEKVILPMDIRKYTYIYITDMLVAIYESMISMPTNQVYNITSEATASTIYDILAIIKNNFGEKFKFSFDKEFRLRGMENAIDGSKYIEYGGSRYTTIADSIVLNIASYEENNKPFVFKDTYNGKIECIREILLAALLEIDRICKKHNIKYFLAGGTLLGAIRHQGFIPWDDDADIMMLREDYERFVKVAPKELSERYFLQTAETDKENHFLSKIRINDTICATKFTKQFEGLNKGFFIDIFPHDITANSRIGQKGHIMATILTRSMVFNKWGNTKVEGDGSHPVIRKVVTLLKNILPLSFLEYIQFKTIRFFEHKKKPKFLYDGMGQNLKRGAFPIEWLNEVEYTKFEGCQFPVPKEYDKYLCYLYGDYKKLISVSERKISHNIYLLDLGEYGLPQKRETSSDIF